MVRVTVSMSGLGCSDVIAGMLDDAGGIEAVIDRPGAGRRAGSLSDVLIIDLDAYMMRKKGGLPPDAKVLVIAPDCEDRIPAIEAPLSGIVRMSANIIELQTAVKAIAKGVVLGDGFEARDMPAAKRKADYRAENSMSI